MQLIGEACDLVHGLGKVPFDGGMDASTYVPLAQSHHF